MIEAIARIIRKPLEPAPSRPHDPLGALMAHKKDTPKYLLQDGHLIGLNLANTALNAADWDNIARLLDFNHLQALNLSDNQLERFAWPANAPALRRLNLGENKLTHLDLPESGPGQMEDLRVEGNDLANLPPEVLRQGRQALLRYWRELAHEKSFVLREAKLVFIGAGGVGKTSLLTKLLNPSDPLPPPEDTTVGIQISVKPLCYAIGGEAYTLHAWDFGGQEIYHPTHQLFMSRRSLYLLLQDGRSAKTDFDYWLPAQQLLAGDSPLLLVQNLRDGARTNVPVEDLRRQYPNIQNYYELNLKAVQDAHHPEMGRLIKELQAQLQRLPHVGERWPQTRLRIRQALEAKRAQHDHLDLDEYRALCTELGYPDPKAQDEFLAQLHDLGTVLHFPGTRTLEDFVIINPQWATDAIYAILDHTQRHAEKHGHFDDQDLKKVWAGQRYKRHFDELLRLMERFELIYEIPQQKGSYIAPLLLPEDRPNFTFETRACLQMRYAYDFMPKGILSRLTVRLHEDIEAQHLLWKRGVVLRHKNSRALVTETYNSRRLQIQAQGPQAGAFIEIICRELDHINKGFYFDGRLGAKKLVPCNCPTCLQAEEPHFYDFQVLEKRRDTGTKKTIECPLSEADISVAGLLERVTASREDKPTGPSEEDKQLIRELLETGKTEHLAKALEQIGHFDPDTAILWKAQLGEISQTILTNEEAEVRRRRLRQSVISWIGGR